MRVADVMTKPVRTIDSAAGADQAWELMRLHRLHHLVVLRAGTVAGIVSSSDLGGGSGDVLRRHRTVEDFMTTHVVTATPRMTLRKAANLMRGHAIECLPVVSKGRLEGILTATAVLDLVGHGTERPVAKSRRFTLSSRGRTPHAQTAAKLAGRGGRKA